MAWTLAALLMFLLTFGQTMLQSPDVINNWLFTVLALAPFAAAGLAFAIPETRGRELEDLNPTEPD